MFIYLVDITDIKITNGTYPFHRGSPHPCTAYTQLHTPAPSLPGGKHRMVTEINTSDYYRLLGITWDYYRLLGITRDY